MASNKRPTQQKKSMEEIAKRDKSIEEASSGRSKKRSKSIEELVTPKKEMSVDKRCQKPDTPVEETSHSSTPNSLDTSESEKSSEDSYKDKPHIIEMFKRTSKSLTKNPWYHGLMPRDEVKELLIKDGDFLVRKTDVEGRLGYALSVRWGKRIRHTILTYKNDMWTLRDIKKPTVTELIEAHVAKQEPALSNGALLISPVPRPKFYILHENIDLKNRIGSGNFGDVYSGTMKNEDGTTTDVAVKQLKETMIKEKRAKFVKGTKIMRKFDHPNIIKFYGFAPQQEPMLIVLELAANGCLKDKLMKNPNLPKDTLVQYTTDACRGMCYLAGREVIHRDIAARNCLLGKKDEVKISGFGLSVVKKKLSKLDMPMASCKFTYRDIGYKNFLLGNKDEIKVSDHALSVIKKKLLKLQKLEEMPTRWLAPEVFSEGEFTTKTDVWAFGVLTWEIFNYCQADPFPGETDEQAKAKILSGQQPMQAPKDSPGLIETVMGLCFTQDSGQRPIFEMILKLLAPKETPPPPMTDFDTC